jgi:DNA-binding transcriptional LysR family regulator
MEVRQLEIFRILARELSFTRTAEKAHCVQSNVTVQIRGIESELGVPLFERLGKQVRMTVNGERLLPYADRILHLLEEASVVAAGTELPAGKLYIGSPESVLTYRLPPVLQVFRSTFPEVDLTFHSSGTRELIPQLEQGELDLGLVIDDAFEHPRLGQSRSPALASTEYCGSAPGRPVPFADRRWLRLSIKAGEGSCARARDA